MGQFDVYEFLRKNRKKWIVSREISKMLKISQGSIMTSLKKLYKGKLILRREFGMKNKYEYKFKGS